MSGRPPPAPCIQQTRQPRTAGARHGSPVRFDLAPPPESSMRTLHGVDAHISFSPPPQLARGYAAGDRVDTGHASRSRHVIWVLFGSTACSPTKSCASKRPPISVYGSRRDRQSTQLVRQGYHRGSRRREAAIIHSRSNGQIEGQITKLELVKRQMCGRAKIDLLEARVIGAV